ncbi:hypothetical protein [Corticibacter populi]
MGTVLDTSLKVMLQRLLPVPAFERRPQRAADLRDSKLLCT